MCASSPSGDWACTTLSSGFVCDCGSIDPGSFSGVDDMLAATCLDGTCALAGCAVIRWRPRHWGSCAGLAAVSATWRALCNGGTGKGVVSGMQRARSGLQLTYGAAWCGEGEAREQERGTRTEGAKGARLQDERSGAGATGERTGATRVRRELWACGATVEGAVTVGIGRAGGGTGGQSAGGMREGGLGLLPAGAACGVCRW
jgi:hypothetical protein